MTKTTDIYSARNFSILPVRDENGDNRGITLTLGEHDFWLPASAASDLSRLLDIEVQSIYREMKRKQS